MIIQSTDASGVLPGLEEYTGAVVSAAALVLLISFLSLCVLAALKSLGLWSMRARTIDMNKYRQYQLDRLMADGIVDHVEELVYSGKVTRAESRVMYEKFGTVLPEIFPRPNEKQRIKKLKRDIKERLRNGVYKKVPLPNETTIMFRPEPVMPMNRLGEILMGATKA
jgi:hypothetical protein